MTDQHAKDNDISENANSSANAGNNNIDENGLFAGDSTHLTTEDYEKDKHGDYSEDDNTVISSGVDDLQFNSGGAAGTDSVGTAERNLYGDTQLNKGLEAQAKDEESRND